MTTVTTQNFPLNFLPNVPIYVNGVMQEVWRQFFTLLWNRTGGNTSVINTIINDISNTTIGVSTDVDSTQLVYDLIRRIEVLEGDNATALALQAISLATNGVPAGFDTAVQYNFRSAFGGSRDFTYLYSNTPPTLQIGGDSGTGQLDLGNNGVNILGDEYGNLTTNATNTTIISPTSIVLNTTGTNALVLNSYGALGIGTTPTFGTSGQVLTSSGTSSQPSWQTPVVPVPGGSSGDFQWNNAGVFAGGAGLAFNGTIVQFLASPQLTQGLYDATGSLGSNQFLFSNGVGVYWENAVTSVGVSSSTLNITGSPITTTGTIDVELTTTGVTPGSYTSTNLIVDAYGRITAASNGSGGSGTPALPYNSVQFNNSGAFGGSSNFEWNNSSQTLTIIGTIVPTTITDGSASVGTSGQVLTSTGTGLAWQTTSGTGTVTSVAVTSSTLGVTGSPITAAGTIDVELQDTAVTPGNYTSTNLTVDQYGRITAAANGTGSSGNINVIAGDHDDGPISQAVTAIVDFGPINIEATAVMDYGAVPLATEGTSVGIFAGDWDMGPIGQAITAIFDYGPIGQVPHYGMNFGAVA